MSIKITNWKISTPGKIAVIGGEDVYSYYNEDAVIEVTNNVVTNAPDVYIWMLGHCFGSIRGWVKVRGGTVEKLKNHEGNTK